MLTRRRFLQALLTLGAAAVVLPEVLTAASPAPVPVPPPVPVAPLAEATAIRTWVPEVGDLFTIAGTYAINPLTGESTGLLQAFVVTAVDEGANVEFSPPLHPMVCDAPVWAYGWKQLHAQAVEPRLWGRVVCTEETGWEWVDSPALEGVP